jgi:hypothetical protein
MSGITTQGSDASTQNVSSFDLDLNVTHDEDEDSVATAMVPTVTSVENSKCLKCGQVVSTVVGILIDDISYQGFVCHACYFTNDEEEFQDSTVFTNDDVPQDACDDSHRKEAFIQDDNEITFVEAEDDENNNSGDEENDDASDAQSKVVLIINYIVWWFVFKHSVF